MFLIEIFLILIGFIIGFVAILCILLPSLLSMHSESDTRAKYIDPKLKSDGWDESHLIREYAFTNGRKLVGGRGKVKFADYLLKYQ